ncbi:MAG TPA: DUF4403 family protein [Chitinophagaceae bacterium]|nr:DUF4403 family protein [Chitinophagaceae bacterium]
MKIAAILFLVFGAVAISCSHRINPDKPSFAERDYRLDSLPESQINLPVQIYLKPLYEMAERSIDTVFTSPNYPDDWIYEGCDMRYKYVFRRSPLRMKASGPTLDLGFTGYYKIVGSTRVCVNGVALSPWTPPCRCGFQEAERRVNVSFSNTLLVQPDYRVRIQFRRNEPEAVDRCEVCFWGTDITKQVMKGLKLELDAARANLESGYGSIDLRPRFQQVWDQLNKVQNLYGLGWLQINPQRFNVVNLFARNDSLNIFLGLTARPVIRFERPDESFPAIPPIGSSGKYGGFNIFLDAVLDYDSLTTILNRQLAGKQFELEKGPVKKIFIVDECRLYGSGADKLIIRVNFSGSNSGTVYFTGRPVYDNESHIISVADVDFDVRSRAALLKAADWLFNRKISNEIARQARFDLSAWVDTARVTVNRQLNREWAPGVRSQGALQLLRIAGIYPTKDRLVIRAQCGGDLFMKVESLDFSL